MSGNGAARWQNELIVSVLERAERRGAATMGAVGGGGSAIDTSGRATVAPLPAHLHRF